MLGRTETIKKRAIYVYLPSIEVKGRCEEYARNQGNTLSKFVVEHVENPHIDDGVHLLFSRTMPIMMGSVMMASSS